MEGEQNGKAGQKVVFERDGSVWKPEVFSSMFCELRMALSLPKVQDG
ncbi:conserved hypothetical protein [delta proteobacterium NaphS2]|nr:conserved hypothetical protein [delta proteobacterium NaphS2]